MDNATLRQRHKAAVGRYHRAMVDGDGLVPDGLLDELGVIADEHAAPEDPASTVRTRHRTRRAEEE
jgi:hypothetical protein